MFIIFSVFYILVAAAMTVLILMQRGEGANAGASFGGGSSGTVFGARGSASFMSRATAVLFAIFIIMSLGMAIYLTHSHVPNPANNLGVMSGVGTSSQPVTPKKASAPAKQAPASAVPQAAQPAAATKPAIKPASARAGSDVPTATVPDRDAAKTGTATTGHGSSGSSSKTQH
ncbi:MAG TPA: preprotein translocase subunit SecG [Rhodanobacteraceae bacterium]